MKTYCESGTFQRGQEAASGDASIAMFGNTNQPIDVMVQIGPPLRADAGGHSRRHGVHRSPAFLPPGMGSAEDAERAVHGPLRIRCRLPGGGVAGIPKAQLHRGDRPRLLVGCASQRARSKGGPEDSLGPDQRSCTRMARSAREELAELLEFAIEGRRRVKEQLKKMGSFEYYHTSFSYTLQETGEERFVGVPEQGGREPHLVRSAGSRELSTPPVCRRTVPSASCASRSRSRLEPGSSSWPGECRDR